MAKCDESRNARESQRERIKGGREPMVADACKISADSGRNMNLLMNHIYTRGHKLATTCTPEISGFHLTKPQQQHGMLQNFLSACRAKYHA